MSIQAIQDAKILRQYCKKLGREGVAKRIVEIAKEIVANEGANVITLRNAGKIRAICTGCGYDIYWDEKQELGRQDMVWEAEHSKYQSVQ